MVVSDANADLSPDTMARLTECVPIRAIKYRTNDAERLLRMTRQCGQRVAVFSGVERNLVAALAAGCGGVIGGGANVFADLLDEIVTAFESRRFEEALALNYTLLRVSDLLPGSRELKFALRDVVGLEIALNDRGSSWEPLAAHERAAIRTCLAGFRVRSRRPRRPARLAAPQ
jgi:dihydrodipicolinate synthase/N-acetylneuraminate lyase